MHHGPKRLSPTIFCFFRFEIALFLNCLIATDADPIPDLLDAHFLKDLLVAFEEIIAVEVIG